MFTGLVEGAGEILRFAKGTKSFELMVKAPSFMTEVSIGDSIAVNGCCLTVVKVEGCELSFDLLLETVKRTSINQLDVGGLINLERSLLPTTRMGGHFVSGHVDETGRIEVLEKKESDFYLKIQCRKESVAYLVEKGCVAVDGISLTVTEVFEDGFSIWLIPHTLEVTNLQERKVGDLVNLEFDLLAKYVEKIVETRRN